MLLSSGRAAAARGCLRAGAGSSERWQGPRARGSGPRRALQAAATRGAARAAPAAAAGQGQQPAAPGEASSWGKAAQELLELCAQLGQRSPPMAGARGRARVKLLGGIGKHTCRGRARFQKERVVLRTIIAEKLLPTMTITRTHRNNTFNFNLLCPPMNVPILTWWMSTRHWSRSVTPC